MKDGTFTAVLAGCGGISKAWFEALKHFPEVSVIGLADLNPDAAEARRQEFELHHAAVASNLGELLARTRPDMVFDCTIPEAHREVVLTAFEFGCHVLGEKPLAPDMAQAREMVAAAERAGRIYAIIQNRRYLDRIVAFRELLARGSIGKLTTLNADFYLAPHFGGFRERMEHVLLLDMAIHSFDQARYLSGADPVEVYCREFNPVGSWYHHGASAMAVFTMSDGSVFNYRGSWCAAGLPTSWQCDWRAVGMVGTARWDGEESLRAERVCAGEGFFQPVETVDTPSVALTHRGHAGVIGEFLDAVRSGRQPQTCGADNLKSLAMVHAAIASAEQRQPVEIEM